MKVLANTALTIAIVFGGFLYPSGIVVASTASVRSLVPAGHDTLQIPLHIDIPTAKVDAPIIPVGVTQTGRLDTPANFVQAGWYEDGVIPGQIGSAVIDGHVDNGGKIPGPFKNLKNVKIGDTISIDTIAGGTLKFKVIRTDVYKTEDFPSEQVFHDDTSALLKIITCHGTFITSEKTYNERLVVTAVLDTEGLPQNPFLVRS